MPPRFFEHAVEGVRPRPSSCAAELTVSSSRTNLPVHADPPLRSSKLSQTLRRTNAIKAYTRSGAELPWPPACAGRQRRCISVKDDGVGILPDASPQMFELFTQGDRTLARSEGAWGSGSAIVKTPGRDAQRNRDGGE